MSFQEQSKVARIVLNQLTDSINSIQSHLFAIFSLSEQWQNSQNSFTLIQASLGSHIDNLETKQKQFELRQISAENQRKQVELRQRRLDSAEKSYEERCREFEKKEKEWKEIVAMEKQKFTEWRERLKAKEKKLKEVEEREKSKSLEFGENRSKELEEREISVQERCKVVELKEKEIDERCQAIELEENRIGKKCIELERREKQLEDRCKVHDSNKKEISEGFRALELREKQLNERFVELGLSDKRINERLQELDLKEDRINEGFSKLELKEKETKDRCQAIELEEKKINDWRKELQRRQKEVGEGFKALEAKEKQMSERLKGLDSMSELIKGRIQGLKSKESSIKEQERAIELRENEMDERSKALDSKEKLIKGRFQELESKESLINEHVKAVKLREKEMDECSKALNTKEEMIKGRFQELELKEGLVNEHERALELKEKELEGRSQVIELESKEKELVICKEQELREKQLDEWFDELDRKEKQIEERLQELELKEKELSGELELKVEEIVELRRALELEKGELNVRCKELDLREKEISERGQAMESKEKQSNEPHGAQVSRGKQLNGRRARKFTEKKLNEQEVKNNDIIERYKEQVLKDNQLCNTDSVVVKTAPHRDLCTKNEFVSLNLGKEIAGRSLQMILNDRFNDHESELLKEEVRKLLIASENPAKLVLGALTGFFPPHLRKGHVVYEAGAVRSSCVLLLEQLLNTGPEVSRAVRKEARKVALLWRERIRKEVSHIVVMGFLLLVAVYRLDRLFRRKDLKKLFEIIDGHRLAPDLRLRLDLVEESNDVLHVIGPVTSSTMDLCNPIEPFCSSMDADALRTYLIEHMTEHDLFQENILDTLRDAPDPAQLVFNVVRTFDQPGSTTVNKTSCIYLLEQFMKLQNQPTRKDRLGSGERSMFQPYQVAPNLYYEAKCFASIWKRRLAMGKTEQLEIYGFLQFLATYKLAKSYDADELFKLFRRLYDRGVYRAEQNPYLCQELGLTKKISGFIKQLIGSNKSLQAVKYIRAFMQEHSFPLAPLLKKHVEFIQEKAVKIQFHGKPSAEKKLKAFGFELGHLRAVVHQIKFCELESQYSSTNLESRIKDLEMAIAELKPVAAEAEGDVIERAVLGIEKAREETDCTKNLEEKTVEDESPQLGKDMTVTDTNSSALTPPSDTERGSHGDLKRAASSYTSTAPPQQQAKRPRVGPSQPPLPPSIPVSTVPTTMHSSPVIPPLQGYFPQPQHGPDPYGHPGHVRPIGNPVWPHHGPLPSANVPPFTASIPSPHLSSTNVQPHGPMPSTNMPPSPASRPSHLSSTNAPPHGPLPSTNMPPFATSRSSSQLFSPNAPPHGPLTSTNMPPFPANGPPPQLSSANAAPHGPFPSTNMPHFAASRPSSHLYTANGPPPGYGVSQQMGVRPFEPAGFYPSGGPAHARGQAWNTQ